MKKRIYILLSNLLDINTPEQLAEIVSSKNHSLPIKNHRASILGKRTSIFALIFAVLIPCWTIVDYVFLPNELWLQLAILRIVSGLIFLYIYIFCRKERCPLNKILICLSSLLYTPALFYLIATPILSEYHFTGLSGAIINIYSLLPFLVVASLTIFALTIKELIVIISPLVIMTIWTLYPQTPDEVSSSVMYIWLFLLLVSTSSFSSISQMRYMISQVTRASFDGLTKAMTRRAGIETIEVYFRMAQLQNNNLSVLFIDLDKFKSINDEFGHEAGDQILKICVTELKEHLRKGDTIIRWGGEEFVILLPQADQGDATRVINRIFEYGIGLRPDGSVLTASMGLSEIKGDAANNWKEMVELADQRMYHAKETGRARCIGANNEILRQYKPDDEPKQAS